MALLKAAFPRFAFELAGLFDEQWLLVDLFQYLTAVEPVLILQSKTYGGQDPCPVHGLQNRKSAIVAGRALVANEIARSRLTCITLNNVGDLHASLAYSALTPNVGLVHCGPLPTDLNGPHSFDPELVAASRAVFVDGVSTSVLATSSDGSLLCFADANVAVEPDYWGVIGTDMRNVDLKPDATIVMADFSDDGTKLMTWQAPYRALRNGEGYAVARIVIYDTRTGAKLAKLYLQNMHTALVLDGVLNEEHLWEDLVIRDLVVDRSFEFIVIALAISDYELYVCTFDVATSRLLRKVRAPPGLHDEFTSPCLSADGRFLLGSFTGNRSARFDQNFLLSSQSKPKRSFDAMCNTHWFVQDLTSGRLVLSLSQKVCRYHPTVSADGAQILFELHDYRVFYLPLSLFPLSELVRDENDPLGLDDFTELHFPALDMHCGDCYFNFMFLHGHNFEGIRYKS